MRTVTITMEQLENHAHKHDAKRANEILRVVTEGETFLTQDNIREVAAMLFRYASKSKMYKTACGIVHHYNCGGLVITLNITNPHIVWGGNIVYSVEALNRLLAE